MQRLRVVVQLLGREVSRLVQKQKDYSDEGRQESRGGGLAKVGVKRWERVEGS